MKTRMSKKIITTFLSLVVLLGAIIPANATEVEKNTAEGTQNITNEDLFISGEVATYIADFFIQDMKKYEFVSWDDSTKIIRTVPLYDQTGDKIVAYTAELNDGYITISAYIDMPSMILEWSDKAAPIYAELSSEPSNRSSQEKPQKIVYLGELNYLIDNGGANLKSVNGIEVPRNSVTEKLSQYRKIDNVKEAALSDLHRAKERADEIPKAMRAGENTPGGYISDVFTFARNAYGGTWTAYDWENAWEPYTHYSITSDFKNYENHCGPTAITNIIKMYGLKYNHSVIKNTLPATVFNRVMEVNTASNNKYYTSSGGTKDNTAGEFMQKSFQKFNVNISVRQYYANLGNIRNSTSGNKLMLIALHQAAPYGDHSVVGYAWTRIRNQSGGMISFVKLVDGHNRSGRFIDIQTISNDKYWEASFG